MGGEGVRRLEGEEMGGRKGRWVVEWVVGRSLGGKEGRTGPEERVREREGGEQVSASIADWA